MKKILDFKDVQVGMTCEDDDGKKYEIVDKGTYKEMCEKTHHRIEDVLDSSDLEAYKKYPALRDGYENMKAVAVTELGNADKIIPMTYGNVTGVACFVEVKKKKLQIKAGDSCCLCGSHKNINFLKKLLPQYGIESVYNACSELNLSVSDIVCEDCLQKKLLPKIDDDESLFLPLDFDHGFVDHDDEDYEYV